MSQSQELDSPEEAGRAVTVDYDPATNLIKVMAQPLRFFDDSGFPRLILQPFFAFIGRPEDGIAQPDSIGFMVGAPPRPMPIWGALPETLRGLLFEVDGRRSAAEADSYWCEVDEESLWSETVAASLPLGVFLHLCGASEASLKISLAPEVWQLTPEHLYRLRAFALYIASLD